MKRETKRRIDYPERIFTSLTDIVEPGFSPVYGEFDTVGVVSSVGAAPHVSRSASSDFSQKHL